MIVSVTIATREETMPVTPDAGPNPKSRSSNGYLGRRRPRVRCALTRDRAVRGG
jgi:hypothetical protein